jgi:hypothetical protein
MKGKGTKWMLVIDGNGLPLGFHLDSATTAEVKLAEQTLDIICVPRSRGVPSSGPKSWSRIVGMIVAISAAPYDGVLFRCASPQGIAPPSGAPNGVVR